jgi:hypothetical protein
VDIFNSKEREIVCVSNSDLKSFGFGENVELLEIGKRYTVVDVEIHSWHTMVTLREIPNKQFNSVHFEEVD